jgi:hypothetical protein
MIVDFNLAFLHELVFKPCEVKIGSNDKGLKGGYLCFATSSKKAYRKIRQLGKLAAYKKFFGKVIDFCERH